AYLGKYKGRFDMGWNAARELILARQKRLGIVPSDAQLPPWPADVPAWDTLTAQQKRLAARAMEAFAAMLDHADNEFGRIVETLRRRGQLENTIILVTSDNGASAEGGLAGGYSETRLGRVTWEENLAFYDRWGGPGTYPHYSVGWAAAGNTPFKNYKQSAHYGGTRVPMVISWPPGIAQVGGVRTQFHHLVDVMPTLLDAIGGVPPKQVDGVDQQRIDGTIMLYAFDRPSTPTAKHVQYFELWGNRGVWADGWKAVVLHRPTPWDVYPAIPLEQDVWELYHVAEVFNERIDLASKYPQKLDEMKKLFDHEAARNNG